jgi:hypothetical protein
MKVLKNYFLLKIISLSLLISCSKTAFCEQDWNDKSGLKKFEQSNFKQDFYQLVNFYQPQNNPTYCGVATSVILLNAIFHSYEIPNQETNQIEINSDQAKTEKTILEFHSFTQQNFLNEKTDKIKNKNLIDFSEGKKSADGKIIYDAGLTLSELSEMLKIYSLKVKKNHIKNCSEKNLALIRNDFKKILADNDNFLVVNFYGRDLGKTTHGHISPVIVYDQISDQALIMDVALHKNHWHWASLTDLCQAMNSLDGDKKRGYLVVSKNKN